MKGNFLKRRLLLSFLFWFSAIAVTITHSEIKEPTFEQYRVAEQFVGKPAPVDLKSAPGASRFRTGLRYGAKKGPNFAGHYTIVEWGCGTGCDNIAVIDAANGRVVFPEELNPLFFPGLPVGKIPEGMVYKKESSLFIVHGVPSTKKKVGSYYFLWKKGRFVLIFSHEWGTASKN